MAKPGTTTVEGTCPAEGDIERLLVQHPDGELHCSVCGARVPHGQQDNLRVRIPPRNDKEITRDESRFTRPFER